MPDIKLDIPANSRFHSSLNEIDIAIKEVLIQCMRKADPRSKMREQDLPVEEGKDDWLWDKTRVFQVDELSTEEIFDTYLLRKKINGENNTDVSYPLLAFIQNDIESVYWGTGNRMKQWEFETPYEPSDWEVGDTVVITTFGKYRGLTGEIAEIKTENSQIYCTVSLNGRVITKQPFDNINDKTKVWFPTEQLRLAGEKTPQVFKGKAVTCTYSCVVLTDNRDELQYIRDKLMLRIWDAHIWWKYKSPTIGNYENQIFTVFGIPNIERYPSSNDKLKGHGFIYGSSFNVNVWATITDEPIPSALIETVRMNLSVEGDDRIHRIVIN